MSQTTMPAINTSRGVIRTSRPNIGTLMSRFLTGVRVIAIASAPVPYIGHIGPFKNPRLTHLRAPTEQYIDSPSQPTAL